MIAKQSGLLSSLIVALVGLLFIGSGYLVHHRHAPYPNGVTTTGTVTAIKSSQGVDGTTVYSPQIAFSTHNAGSDTISGPKSSSPRLHVGQRVTISYRPANVGSARIVPDHDWIAFLCYIIGCLIIVTGFVPALRRNFTTALMKLSTTGPAAFV